ncbi:MAG: nucleotidyl transferase AbiEii/AbiGii toxin family protein [Thiomicrospira sp.]|jgi:predicted nucleotidyltransferase|nr:nucleotidyl transferase AbiEii/AbiGii toxin family protein [Thiomicrospira sp.]
MNSGLIDIRGKLPQGLVTVYRQVQNIADQLQLDVVVVGAMARDLVLVHGFNARLERGTRDIDFAVHVADWSSFHKLSEKLMVSGFKRADKLAHRFYVTLQDGMDWEVDIIPFGDLADAEKKIKWPPDESIMMSVLGFDEAFDNALTVQMGEMSANFMMKVVSPAAMSILKLISWLEREPIIRKKDAQDLRYLMKTYSKIPIILDKMYDQGFMEAQDWDEERASAMALGFDARKIVKQQTYDFLYAQLFSKSEKLDVLMREMVMQPVAFDYDVSELKVYIDAFFNRTKIE